MLPMTHKNIGNALTLLVAPFSLPSHHNDSHPFATSESSRMAQRQTALWPQLVIAQLAAFNKSPCTVGREDVAFDIAVYGKSLVSEPPVSAASAALFGQRCNARVQREADSIALSKASCARKPTCRNLSSETNMLRPSC